MMADVLTRYATLPEPAATQEAIRQDFTGQTGPGQYRHMPGKMPPRAIRARMAQRVLGMFGGQFPGAPGPDMVPSDVMEAYGENPDWDAEDIKGYLARTRGQE